VRLFFALWPDSHVCAHLAHAAAAVPLDGRARGVPAENYHLTLAFLGEVAAPQLGALQQIGCALRVPPCRIDFDAYEYWPEPQVVVAAARQSFAALLDLCAQLHQGLSRCEAAPHFKRPISPWRAHVTLARKVSQAPVLQAMSPFHWNARSFSLVCSDTRGGHSVYTVVDTWPLLDEHSNT
jgi:RNA 2',3'-cyclic 3'-phosphodiesterase